MRELRFPLIMMLLIAVAITGGLLWMGIDGLFQIGNVSPELDRSRGTLFIVLAGVMAIITKPILPIIKGSFKCK